MNDQEMKELRSRFAREFENIMSFELATKVWRFILSELDLTKKDKLVV